LVAHSFRCSSLAKYLLFAIASLVPGRANAETSPYLLRLDAGVPRFSSGDRAIVGDATVGYSTPSLGTTLRGGLMQFEASDASSFSKIERGEGALDGRYSLGDPDAAVRLELRAAASVTQFKSTQTGVAQGQAFFRRDKSLIERATAFAGAHAHDGDALRGTLLLGASLQHERYSTIDTSGADLFDHDSRLGVAFEVQAHGLWRFAEPYASLRVDGFGRYFQLTKQVITVTQSGAIAVAGGQFTTLELDARALVTADFARLVGIVPGLFFGLEHLSIGSGDGSTSATVPFAGVGLVSADD
jgi:hypothetical protein